MLKIVNKEKLASVIIIMCSLGTGIAMLPMPYSFYIFLRIVFFVSLLTLAYLTYEKLERANITICISIVVAFLYNPIFLIHLGSKSVWLMVNA